MYLEEAVYGLLGYWLLYVALSPHQYRSKVRSPAWSIWYCGRTILGCAAPHAWTHYCCGHAVTANWLSLRVLQLLLNATASLHFWRGVHQSSTYIRALTLSYYMTPGGVCCTCDSCSGCECEQVRRCAAELLLIIDHPLCQQPEGCHIHIPNFTGT